MIRLSDIEAHAKAAPRGRWHQGPHYRNTVVAEGAGELAVMARTPQGNLNAAYVASVDPVVASALVDVARKARAFIDKLCALDPVIVQAFAFQELQGRKYDGGTWEQELADLASALTEVTE